ncbi:MAG: hypothetical protein Ta2G_09760 [Termitinemataceae bacterium]|nr:MAG: hypothetical protein Ta2G_09760 [Termitinemataceae bacterium]
MNNDQCVAVYDTARKLFAKFDDIKSPDEFVDFVRENFYDEYRNIFDEEKEWCKKDSREKNNDFVYFCLQHELPKIYGTNPLSLSREDGEQSSLTELKIIVFYNNLLKQKLPTPFFSF